MRRILILILFAGYSNLFSQDLLVRKSDLIPLPDSILVYKPSNHFTNKKLPLAILLHGWHQNYKYWDEVTSGLQQYADKYNFIFACPDGLSDSWYVDSPVNPEMKVESFFINELIPNLVKAYDIDDKNIFICGLSMGGHGAMYLFLKHQDIFKSAGSLSGTLDITAFPNTKSMLNAFGKIEENPDNWNKNSVYYLLDSLKRKDKEFIFDCGTDDFLYHVNKRFYEKCLDLKIKATFISQPGIHRIYYWQKTFENHFRFFNRLAQSGDK